MVRGCKFQKDQQVVLKTVYANVGFFGTNGFFSATKGLGAADEVDDSLQLQEMEDGADGCGSTLVMSLDTFLERVPQVLGLAAELCPLSDTTDLARNGILVVCASETEQGTALFLTLCLVRGCFSLHQPWRMRVGTQLR